MAVFISEIMTVIQVKIKRFVLQNKWLQGLLGVYVLFRLSNLTLLPIFNDEAIYLDWGWRETHSAGNLYY